MDSAPARFLAPAGLKRIEIFDFISDRRVVNYNFKPSV